MDASPDARQVIRRYVAAWTGGQRDALHAALAADAVVEWNLDLPARRDDLVTVLLAVAAAGPVTVVSENHADGRAALVYDCATTFGTVRTAEFLAVAGDRIGRVRQVYDLAAVRRFLPHVDR